MNITLKDIIAIAKDLPEKYYEEIYEKLSAVKAVSDSEKEAVAKVKLCPHCGSNAIVRNGKRHGRQAYICRDCDKTFTETTGTAIENTKSSPTVWRQVIHDTVEGGSIDKTADGLDLHHETVFYMRHKILYCVEQALLASPVALSGVSEADETYVLESEKGRKFPENHHRKPRKRGGKASKRGLSDEQVCICSSVNSDSECVAVTVNRAAPSKSLFKFSVSESLMTQ